MPSSLRRTLTSSKGFTLIELLIVITILAGLMILAFINGPRFITKANDAERKSDLEAYKIMFEHYYEDHGCYPDETLLTSCSTPEDSIKPYLPKMLCDPQTRQPYTFKVEGCNSYKIFTSLDNADDPEIARIGCTEGCGIEGEYEGYNYGVSSADVRVGDPNIGHVVEDPQGTTPPATNPGGSSQGNNIYIPLNCVLQPNGTWACSCVGGSSCGVGCPGNTLCSPDGTYCSSEPAQCPVGPQH